ncbi:MAG TPA: metalloregulator ArsR/SmtB family transcription factor [Thermoplasmata archaeon]|nr:metalloregulator ArsR/SmtB family transcription factor [Thermoplasmata archaeon]
MAAVLDARPMASDDLDAVFHALSDRTRRSILHRLADRPATVGDLAGPFAMSLPAVSKHVKVLESAGLISRTVEGRLHRCSLAPAALRTADDWLAPYREFWSAEFESLDRHLRQGVSTSRDRSARRTQRKTVRAATRRGR